MSEIRHEFGGEWTEEKLLRLDKYLRAYSTIMANKRFKYAYVDAFAGTGYRQEKERATEFPFPEAEEDAKEFRDGSARIALKVEPRFDKYIFIEKSEDYRKQLERLKDDFPHLRESIDIRSQNANEFLDDFCKKNFLRHHRRAVMFLDPYGMDIEWKAMEQIAKTQAIDVWILFPIGMGIMRMLPRTGEVSPSWKEKLNRMFGAEDWYAAFYEAVEQEDIFGEEHKMYEKTATFESIAEYYLKRLRTIFPGVANNPLLLKNSRGFPMYLLCFACANRTGAPTAINIAQDILKE